MDYQATTTALITPLQDDRIHYDSLQRLLQRQLDNNITQLVVLGTTAENALLNDYESAKLMTFIRQYVGNRCQLIVNVGCPSTKATVTKAKKYTELGADALMVVAPYYTKSTEEGLLLHYKTIKDNTILPIIAYNVPSRTGYSMTAHCLSVLYDEQCISALKQCSAQLTLAHQLERLCPKLPIMCGDDSMLLQYKKLGHNGNISVLSNAFPHLISHLNNSQKHILKQLTRLIQLQHNPIAIKYILYKLGIITSCDTRLPLTPLQLHGRTVIDQQLSKIGDIL